VDELIKKITDNFDDIDPEKAKGIIDTVGDFLAEKLPGGIGEKVQGFLQGDNFDVGDMLGQAKDALGGLFGGKD